MTKFEQQNSQFMGGYFSMANNLFIPKNDEKIPPDLFSLFSNEISKERIRQHAIEFNRLEGNISYSNFTASTDYCMKVLEESGVEQISRIALPSDGKTAYLDCIMPQAWDTIGRSCLRLEDPNMTESEQIIADTDEDPFVAGIWSAPTPPEGINCEIVDYRTLAPERLEVKDKLVLMDGYSQTQYKAVSDGGAAGVIISNSTIGEQYPDHVRWCNGIGFTGWYHTREDRRIVVFLLTPRRAEFLRQRLAKGKLTAHAVMNTRIYDGEIFTVTGVIPGKSKKEIVLLAHLYEPFLPDDAAGPMIIAEICSALKSLIASGKLPSLQKTIRVVFSMERYGFSQYFADRKRNRRSLAVFSFDSVCHINENESYPHVKFRRTSDAVPSFVDFLFREALAEKTPHLQVMEEVGNLSDDTFCSEPLIGIPSVWLHSEDIKSHHNTGPAFMNADWNLAVDMAMIYGGCIGLLALNRADDFKKLAGRYFRLAVDELKQKIRETKVELKVGAISPRKAAAKILFNTDIQAGRMRSFNRFSQNAVKQSDITRRITEPGYRAAANIKLPACYDLSTAIVRCANIVVKRLVPGTIMSLAGIPHSERKSLCCSISLNLLFSFLDGKRTLAEALDCCEFSTGQVISNGDAGKIYAYFRYLERYGYVKITDKYLFSGAELEKAFRGLGITGGDRLVIHSSLASLGQLQGGAETFCNVAMKLVSSEGTLLMPAFNFFDFSKTNGVFDPALTPTATGGITEFFRTIAGVYRSLNPTHSFCAWGKDAANYVKGHHRTLTMGADSPLGLLEKKGGKILLVSCPDSNTFMHVVETTNSAPCLGYRTEEYAVKLRNGQIVKCRTWGWRGGVCPVWNASVIYNFMRSNGTLRELMLGNAHFYCMDMNDFRFAYEHFLNAGSGCRICSIKPRKIECTVVGDWDTKQSKLVKSDAFVEEYQPFCSLSR